MINILFIHQSAELYGSDKTLLLFLKNIDKTQFKPIVILPIDGPLKDELEKIDVQVIIAPVLKLYRKMFTFKNIIKFFKDIKVGFKIIDEINKKEKIDIIYSNTLAVLLGLFYAKKRKTKHVWHVHEIIESPKIFTFVFTKLLSSKATNTIIYNSIATKNFWNKNKKINKKSIIVCNGLEVPTDILTTMQIEKFREENFNATSSQIIIALVGRISRWKGQKVLLNSFYQILKKHNDIKLIFVGSPPPNQELFLIEIKDQINQLNISDKVQLIPFTNEISKIWQSIDIAVVPSIEPEPFGLVAVEAMLAHKPLIGSNHGGLTEIIINNETGFLVEPKNEETLSNALIKLIENPSLRSSFGEKGYQRAINEFSIDTYVKKLENTLLNR